MDITHKVEQRDLEKRIGQLLSAPEHLDHPLREALEELWEAYCARLARIERITQLSDAYQRMAQQDRLSLSERFDKEIRQLEKIVRISDRYQEMMQRLNAALVKAATHDSLTGLANRNLIIERLTQESNRASRHNHSFVLGMLDIDYFKQFNDTRGHEFGDRLLVAVAHAMKATLREYDLCGRWGGDEFILVFPETALSEAGRVVERLQFQLSQISVDAVEDGIAISVSIGMTEYRSGEDFARTINRADMALLEAKRQGRGRCIDA